MGFNERNFYRAQANFSQLAQQLNEFTEWALEELKRRDLELKETHIHLKMAKKQIDLLVGELADAKREIEDLKEQLAESGQVIAMPTAEVFTPEPEPETTYDELMQRAGMIQAQMRVVPQEKPAAHVPAMEAYQAQAEPVAQASVAEAYQAQAEPVAQAPVAKAYQTQGEPVVQASAMESYQEQVEVVVEAPVMESFQERVEIAVEASVVEGSYKDFEDEGKASVQEDRHFVMDLDHSGPAAEVASAADHTFVAQATGTSSKAQVFTMDLDMDEDKPGSQESLVEEPDPNFFAPAIAAIDRGDRAEAVRFLRQSEDEWQAGDQTMARNYFDLMDQLILAAEGYETVVRPALIQMVHYAASKNQIDAARTFIQLNSGSLETIIQTSTLNAHVFMDLSILYFQLQMKYEFKRWMRVNHDQNRLQNYAFQEKELWNLLYMALYYDQDQVIKEGAMAMKAKIMRPIPEAKLYREYVQAIREGRAVEEAQVQFDDRTTFMRYVDQFIRDIVFPVMKDRLSAKADELRNQPNQEVEQAPAEVEAKPEVAIISEEISEKERAKVSQVYLVGGDGRQCPIDQSEMAYEEVDLLTFGSTRDRDLNQGGKYQKVRLLHCPTCQRYYINQFIRWGIAGFIQIGELKDREEHHIG
jgi:hypothetical protein